MSIDADFCLGPEANKWLNSIKEGSRETYKPGLTQFKEFLIEFKDPNNQAYRDNQYGKYLSGASIGDYMRAILADRQKPNPLEQIFIDQEVLKIFGDWLVKRSYKPKSVNTYAGAVQSLCKFWRIPISLEYCKLPVANPASRKYPWELDTMLKFIKMMDDNFMYQTMAVSILQSGLGVKDLLMLDFDAIKLDFQIGVVPFCLDLYRIKTNTPHLTFIGVVGATMIREYIGSQQLQDNEKLFKVDSCSVERYFKKKATEFLGSEIDGTNPCRPHSMRSAFDTLMTDEGCPESIVEFFMGHRMKDVKKVYKSKTHDGWRKTYGKYAKPLNFKL